MVWYILMAIALAAAIVWRIRKQQMDARPADLSCENWTAFHDRTPGPAGKWGTLSVKGKCTFPTSGYTVELRRHEPQGINHEYLLLEKVVHKPTGTITQVVTVVPVRYSEVTETAYRFVTILPDIVTISVAAPRAGVAV